MNTPQKSAGATITRLTPLSVLGAGLAHAQITLSAIRPEHENHRE